MPSKSHWALSLCYTYQTIRFRLVPTFGRDTIRRFSSNVSGLTKLTARDFEDILQVRDTPMDIFPLDLTLRISALSQSLMDYSLTHMTP